VAFGAGGPHFCLGASLARLEAKIMFEAILTRFVGLDIDGDPATFPRVHSNLIDGYSRLPIRWDTVR
jgi:cytochrome P450